MSTNIAVTNTSHQYLTFHRAELDKMVLHCYIGFCPIFVSLTSGPEYQEMGHELK